MAIKKTLRGKPSGVTVIEGRHQMGVAPHISQGVQGQVLQLLDLDPSRARNFPPQILPKRALSWSRWNHHGGSTKQGQNGEVVLVVPAQLPPQVIIVGLPDLPKILCRLGGQGRGSHLLVAEPVHEKTQHHSSDHLLVRRMRFPGHLFKPQRVGDFKGSFLRSFWLAGMVMLLTVIISLAAGLAFRKGFKGDSWVFYLTISSLIVPSILLTLGIGLQFDQLSLESKWYSSGLGAHLSWTLPFGLLIMFAVFNRFDKSYEEAARDMGATPRQVIQYVVVPIIAPSLVGVGLFGFTLSFDEFARSLLAMGVYNTLPLEIFGMTTTVTTPTLYALGTLTTAVSFLIIGVSFGLINYLRKRRKRLLIKAD